MAVTRRWWRVDGPGAGLRSIGERLEGDAVAEGLELFDRAGLGLGWDVSGEVVGAGVAVEGAVGEHVPPRDQHRVLNGDERFHRPAAVGDAPVLRAEVGALRPASRQSGDAERAFEVPVAGARLGRL